MTSPHTIVFDLDGTLVDTAPDLITALNYVLDREGLPPVPMQSARNMIGAGARKLIERGLEAEGRTVTPSDMDRMTADFIAYYAEHIAVESRPFEGLEAALDHFAAQGHRLAVCTNKLDWLSKKRWPAPAERSKPASWSAMPEPTSAWPGAPGCP
jgi:phosphoglycolate phosphatase